MATELHIEVLDRRVQAQLRTRAGEQALVAPRTPVRCLAETLPLILRQAALHLNYRQAGDSEAPAMGSFRNALVGARVGLHLHGHGRELDVMVVLLSLELAIPLPQLKGTLGLHPEAGVACSYDTLGASLSTELIQRHVAQGASVVALLQKAGRPVQNLRDTKGDPIGRMIAEQRVTLGLVGATGAGKSTLLNALLECPGLFPTDTDVCTVVPTFVADAKEGAQGFEVEYLSEGTILDTVQALRSELQLLLDQVGDSDLAALVMDPVFAELYRRVHRAPQPKLRSTVEWAKARATLVVNITLQKEQQQQLGAELRTWRSILHWWPRRPLGRQADLTTMRSYIARDRMLRSVPGAAQAPPLGQPTSELPPRLYQAVHRVNAFLARPILRYLRFVDAAGLSDSDAGRRERTLGMLRELNAWLLVNHGEQRAFEDVDRLLNLVKESAHVPEGAMILTKIDALKQQDNHRTFDELLHERVKHYKKLVPAVAVACPLAAEFISGPAPGEDRRDQLFLEWTQRPWGRALMQGWNPHPLVAQSRKDGAVNTALGDHLVGEGDTHGWRLWRDLQLELSGLIPALSVVMDQLSALLGTILGAERQGMVRDLDTAADHFRSVAQRARELRDSANQVDTLKDQIATQRLECAQKEKQLGEHKEDWADIKAALGRARKLALENAERKADSLVSHVWSKNVEAEARKAAEGQLRGPVTIKLGGHLVGPLTQLCDEQTDLFLQAIREETYRRRWIAGVGIEAMISSVSRNYRYSDVTAETEYENFFERFHSTLERLRASTEKGARNIADSLVRYQLPAHLDMLRKEATGLVQAELTRQRDMVSELQQQMSANRQLLDELVGQTQGKPRDFFETRRRESEELCAAITALRADLVAQGAEE